MNMKRPNWLKTRRYRLQERLNQLSIEYLILNSSHQYFLAGVVRRAQWRVWSLDCHHLDFN